MRVLVTTTLFLTKKLNEINKHGQFPDCTQNHFFDYILVHDVTTWINLKIQIYCRHLYWEFSLILAENMKCYSRNGINKWLDKKCNTLRLNQNGRHFARHRESLFIEMKKWKFRINFHWNLIPMIQSTIYQHWWQVANLYEMALSATVPELKSGLKFQAACDWP